MNYRDRLNIILSSGDKVTVNDPFNDPTHPSCMHRVAIIKELRTFSGLLRSGAISYAAVRYTDSPKLIYRVQLSWLIKITEEEYDELLVLYKLTQS